MHKLLTTIAAAAAFIAAGSVTNRADAMPLGDPVGSRAAIDDLNIVDNVQYFWGGRRYCWYDDGWNGPGLYDCGYRHRHGKGWHGRRDGHNDQGRVDDRGRRDDRNGRNEGVEWQGRR